MQSRESGESRGEGRGGGEGGEVGLGVTWGFDPPSAVASTFYLIEHSSVSTSGKLTRKLTQNDPQTFNSADFYCKNSFSKWKKKKKTSQRKKKQRMK